MKDSGLPKLRDVEEAESRLRRYFPPTPLEHSKALSLLCGRDVYLKLEVFNPIRVFKLRGALNKLLCLGDSSLRRGVLTASSGNHGLAVAYAARLLGTRAVICVPDSANPQKVSAIEEQGAEVLKVGSNYDQVYENSVKIARRRGLTFVHAFDDRDVIAGQGTCGLEIARQLPEADSVVVPIGGGGLISGVAIALKSLSKGVRVYGVETEAIPSMYVSLARRERTGVRPRKTIADGMQASIPGKLTFEAVSMYVDRVALVGDTQIEDAVYELLSTARVLAEPAGASPLAALRGPLRKEPGESTVLLVSGGNISLQLLSLILSRRERRSRRGS
jgi:threonine dehydratase